MNTTDLMIDLETLSTTPQTAVVSIGAQYFNPFTGAYGPSFEMVLELQSQIDAGREISASTLKWWFSQAEAAKKVFHEQAADPKKVLETFTAWYATNGGTSAVQLATKDRAFVWGNGATFDISIMEDLFRTYGFELPWAYNKAMDLRTFKRFNSPANSKVQLGAGIAHKALDDAKGQAQFVIDHLKGAR